MVEQLIRNEKVEGSTPFSGTNSCGLVAERPLTRFALGDAWEMPGSTGNGFKMLSPTYRIDRHGNSTLTACTCPSTRRHWRGADEAGNCSARAHDQGVGRLRYVDTYRAMEQRAKGARGINRRSTVLCIRARDDRVQEVCAGYFAQRDPSNYPAWVLWLQCGTSSDRGPSKRHRRSAALNAALAAGDSLARSPSDLKLRGLV